MLSDMYQRNRSVGVRRTIGKASIHELAFGTIFSMKLRFDLLLVDGSVTPFIPSINDRYHVSRNVRCIQVPQNTVVALQIVFGLESSVGLSARSFSIANRSPSAREST